MASYASYVICTSPRSGSTLLCDLLAATGCAGNPDSQFHNPSIADWLRSFDLKTDDFASQRDALRAVFDAACVRGTGDAGLFGLRLQRRSFDFLIQQIGILHPGLENDVARFEAAFGTMLFIHLTRRDKLKQAVSFVKATQTGLWHRAADGTELERLSDPQDPVYDTDEIARHLAEMIAMEADWEDWFATEKIEPLRVIYEELSADPGAVLGKILDRLGLDPDAATGVHPAVAKLADETNRRWIARFRAERGV